MAKANRLVRHDFTLAEIKTLGTVDHRILSVSQNNGKFRIVDLQEIIDLGKRRARHLAALYRLPGPRTPAITRPGLPLETS